ncbi:26651_t:CDS:2, partial [Gigaspora margarita]
MTKLVSKNLDTILAGKLIEDTKITNTFFKDLVEDFKKLYESKEHHDTIITVGKEPNVEQIPAHSAILCTRSSYFHSALSDKWVKRKNGYLVLSKPNISALTFKIILKFLYCGNVDLKSQESGTILELLVATDEFLIHQLTYFVQDFLIKNKYIFLKRCPVKMFNFIAHHERFNELREVYLENICKYPLLLFDSEEFPLLEEDALKLILKCDNLDMKECFIWKRLVKWGFAQHTTPENKMTCRDTRVDAINILKKTLHELIKFIRFHQIDRKDIIPEVWDYKDILPNDLLKDILHCYLDLDVKPLHQKFLIRWGNFKSNSNLINREIALLFTKWIDEETINNKTSKGFRYKFNLLFRSSLDGEGPDLYVPDNSNIWKFKAKTYPKLVDPNSLTISDYEVFQVEQIQ